MVGSFFLSTVYFLLYIIHAYNVLDMFLLCFGDVFVMCLICVGDVLVMF